ncbi:hypothetical protein [Aquimarina macrocephali]|uniref:hypothetical protein n=1 Tax=Aquimarina macrocephali TaxID=666563 RepID=UPI003F681CAA
MKKRIVTLLVFVGIVAFIIFSGCKKQKVDPAFDKTICFNYTSDPISKIPVGLVHDMVNGYKTRQLAKINEGLKIDDARAIWFDLETLKKFIYHIESVTIENNSSKSKEDLGIRIYYASYPSKDTWENTPKYHGYLNGYMNHPETMQYEIKHTLVMIPTIKIDNIDVDFNPLDTITYNHGLQDTIKYGSTSEFPTFGLNLMPRLKPNGGGSILGRNHGGLFPPKKEEGFGF